MPRFEAEVDLGGSGAAEALVGPKVSVVEKTEFQSSPAVSEDQRFERAQREHVFEGSPEPFDEGDRAGPADGAEALANTEAGEDPAEDSGGELRAFVGDEAGSYGSNGIGTVVQARVATPFLRAGVNFHFLTADTAASVKPPPAPWITSTSSGIPVSPTRIFSMLQGSVLNRCIE